MCTGLCLPQNQPANSSSTSALQSSTRQKRSTASASYERCSSSSAKGVVIGTPKGFSTIVTSTPRAASIAWSCRSKAATDRPSTSANDSSARAVSTTSRWVAKSKRISNGVPSDACSSRVVSPCTSR